MRAERGFTLLEVMAAVAILGLVYTVLATAATQGVRSEGESRRRMEASLLADATLAEIETQLASGVSPDTGVTDEEVEEFRVVVEVTPFRWPPGFEDLQPEAETGAADVLGDAALGLPSLVQRIDVRVVWSDGLLERSVERTTVGLRLDVAEGLVGSPELVQELTQ